MTCNALSRKAAARNPFTVVGTSGDALPPAQGATTIDAGAFPEPGFGELHTCWRRFGRRGEIPQRSAIDPTVLPRRLLPNLSILEHLIADRRERFRYRLAGTAIEQAAGRGLTGCFLDEILPANRYGEHLFRQIRLLLARHAPVYSEGAYLTAVEGQVRLRTTCHLMLPLADGAGEIRYILAAQTFGTLSNINHAPFLLADDFRPGRMAVVRTA